MYTTYLAAQSVLPTVTPVPALGCLPIGANLAGFHAWASGERKFAHKLVYAIEFLPII